MILGGLVIMVVDVDVEYLVVQGFSDKLIKIIIVRVTGTFFGIKRV